MFPSITEDTLSTYHAPLPRGTIHTERLPFRFGKFKLGLYNILGPGLGKNWAHKEEDDDYQMNNLEMKVCFFQDFYLGYFMESVYMHYVVIKEIR